MARSKFGGTSDDYVFYTVPFGVNQVVSLGSSVTLTFWNAPTGGTRYTDLLLNGSPVTTITTSGGWIPEFQGPDGITEMYADSGATTRGVLFAQGQQGPTGPAGPSIAAWAAATAYTTGQVVSVSGVLYQSNDNHTSAGTWAADSSHWTAIGPVASVVGQSGAVTGSQIAADPALLGTYAASVLPSYVGSRSNRFDGLCGYNFKASNTSRLRAAVGRVATGTGTGELGFIGDSLTPGSTTGGGTYQATSGWPSFMRSLNPVLPAASQADGWVRTVTVQGTTFDPRMTYGGTGWASSSGAALSTVVNDTVTYTASANGTTAAFEYYDFADGSAFTASVNGASSGAGFTTVTQTVGNTTGWKVITFTGFAAANNIQIKHTVQGTVGIDIAAIALVPANALLFHNVALGGSTATGTGTLSWTDASTVSSPWTMFVAPHKLGLTRTDPDAVFIGLGANDMKTQTAAATKAAVQTVANAYPNSDIILVATEPLNTTYFSDSAWQGYVSALYDLADTNNWPLLDFRNLSGTYSQAVASGFTVDGQGHFLPFANAMLGRAAAKVLM